MKSEAKAATESKTKKPLVLVDGSSYLYRAFHAMPNLNNSHGEPTGAIYGITNMLRRLLSDYDPDQIAVVFDAKGKNFRHDMYPEYKANRPPMPDELRRQIEPVHDIVRAMGLPLLSVPGVEADDVIGTLARQAAAAGQQCVISTGDKDMAQLVDDHVTLINTMTETVSDAEQVEQKFGVPPERIVDYLALVGDSSDNIPGVPKVGPKTAAKWLQQYHSLDDLMAKADEVGGKVGENLRESMDQLPLSRVLATIRTDIRLDVNFGELQRQPADENRLRDLYQQFEFKTWLGELGGANASEDSPGQDYKIVLQQKQLDKWLADIKSADVVAVDTETTSLDAHQAEIVGISLSIAAGSAAYIPLGHDYPGAPEQLDRDAVLKQMRAWLQDKTAIKVGQNIKYDMNVLARYDIELQGVEYDTMLESYVLDSTASRHDMDSLAMKYLGHKTIKYEDVAGKGKSQIGFSEVELDKAGPYAAEDADVTLRLHQALWPKLEGNASLLAIYRDMEMPLIPVLSRMERNGVLIDADMLHKQSSMLAHRMMEVEQQAHELAGQAFNMASPKQIQEILFDKLELPVLRKTPKGQPSTAEEVLQELSLDYELPQMILEHRGLAKLKSTYTDKLPLMINPYTGRVHTSYHQAVAATGRLSSSDPNLQNIPVRNEEGRRIRQAFIPEKGYRMVSADYSQVELRIMAHLSEDEGLLKAFSEGADVHRATAAEVFGLKQGEVTAEQRRHAKAINFGLIYGMSAFGLARQLKIDRGAAQDYINLYFERYPGVKDYMDRTRQQAHEQGYVETVYGRRLYLPEINSSNHQRRQYAERTAINAPMQGTAADIIKRAMIVIDNWIQAEQVPVRMIMQVHDELVFEIREQQVDEMTQNIVAMMTGVTELRVPLEVDAGSGNNWDEAH